MNYAKAYCQLSLKMIFKDKISFIWSIIFPGIFIVISPVKYSYHQMAFVWAFMIFSCYTIGVGVHSLSLRVEGQLKTFFSIKKTPFGLFFGLLLTEIVFCGVSIIILNILASLVNPELSIITLMLEAIKLMILSVPLAFIFYNITLITLINSRSLSAILQVISSISFIMLQYVPKLNKINPIFWIASISQVNTIYEWGSYLIVAIIFILLGINAIRLYQPISDEVR